MSDQDPPSPDAEDDEVVPAIAETVTGQPAPPLPKLDAAAGASAKSERPRLELVRDPLYREARGYRMRLDRADLARLRELPGSKGKSDEELGEAFFDGQSDRFTTALAEDVPAPAEIRVVVDPYSRQAFLALENKIRAILSF
ncbi:MAG TPA: hypothetical protein VGS00_01510 [Thermoanaerobaculia bacterium]|nr:hypothetical protein [Thermoanaerobaculia bacterium]